MEKEAAVWCVLAWLLVCGDWLPVHRLLSPGYSLIPSLRSAALDGICFVCCIWIYFASRVDLICVPFEVGSWCALSQSHRVLFHSPATHWQRCWFLPADPAFVEHACISAGFRRPLTLLILYRQELGAGICLHHINRVRARQFGLIRSLKGSVVARQEQ